MSFKLSSQELSARTHSLVRSGSRSPSSQRLCAHSGCVTNRVIGEWVPVCLSHRRQWLWIVGKNLCVVNEGVCFLSLQPHYRSGEADVLAFHVGSQHLACLCGFRNIGTQQQGSELRRGGDPPLGETETLRQKQVKGTWLQAFFLTVMVWNWGLQHPLVYGWESLRHCESFTSGKAVGRTGEFSALPFGLWYWIALIVFLERIFGTLQVVKKWCPCIFFWCSSTAITIIF